MSLAVIILSLLLHGDMNTPVLAVDGVAVSRGVDHGEAELHPPLLDLHGGRLDLHRPLDLLCGETADGWLRGQRRLD